MDKSIDWVTITHLGREIGAVGFFGDKVASVVSYFDYKDGNRDGKVTGFERLGAGISPVDIKNRYIVEVIQAASVNSEVVRRDTEFAISANKAWSSLFAEMHKDAFFKRFLKPGIGRVAKSTSRKITKNKIKQVFIRKGMEEALKQAYDAGLQ